MLFITNRLPKNNCEPALNLDFQFDLENNAAGKSVFFCERLKGKNIELGSQSFLTQVKQSAFRQVLIYIHGFANLPDDVFAATEELQTLCDQTKAGEVLVIPLIWPCDNDFGIIKDYWDDQKSADQSAFAFSRVMQKFLAWRNSETLNPSDDPCLKRINLLSHSMGNRVLRETLAAWQRYDQPHGLPLLFRNTFMVAADVVNETLQKGEPGELISHASRNVVTYYASDDLALRASKVSNLKNGEASRRLGHSGPENMELVPGNVFALDCDDVNTRYDYPKGHSYFRYAPKRRPGVVFKHIFQTILTGRPFPDDQAQRRQVLRDG